MLSTVEKNLKHCEEVGPEFRLILVKGEFFILKILLFFFFKYSILPSFLFFIFKYFLFFPTQQPNPLGYLSSSYYCTLHPLSFRAL